MLPPSHASVVSDCVMRVQEPLRQTRDEAQSVMKFPKPEPRRALRSIHEQSLLRFHDERESAVAMVRAAVSSYERVDVNPEEVVGDMLKDA